MSELEPGTEVQLLMTFAIMEQDELCNTDNLLLLQRVIFMLNGNPVLVPTHITVNKNRPKPKERASHRCSNSSVQHTLHWTVPATRTSRMRVDYAMYANATTEAGKLKPILADENPPDISP